MKKILILGAGVYQVPLIQKAKDLGLYTIVVSVDGNYPGFAIADRVYYVNTTDKNAVLKIAKEEGVSGICTTGTDVAVITLGYVCERLGLSGLSYESAMLATDKAKMKKAFLENNVNTARFKVCSSLEESLSAYELLRKPVMFKIVDKSGSRGIIKVENKDEIPSIYKEMMAITKKSYIIVEEYISGIEIGLDAFVQRGKIKLMIPHEKIVFNNGKAGVPLGHVLPYYGGYELQNRIQREAKKVIDALHLDNCAVNMDLFVTNEGNVSIIEAGGRAGATGIPEVISYYTGTDYYEAILLNALGISVDFHTETDRAVASMLLYSKTTGVLKDVHYNQEANVSVTIDYKKGDYIHKFENGTHRIGQAILWDCDYNQLMSKLEEFQNSLTVEVNGEVQVEV